jgi:hypothetical protein
MQLEILLVIELTMMMTTGLYFVLVAELRFDLCLRNDPSMYALECGCYLEMGVFEE